MIAGKCATLREASVADFAQVQATNFPERASALAAEIGRSRPLLVGLQEVSLFRSGPVRPFGAPPSASTVQADYLAILQGALAARGLHYAPVAVATNADLEAPVLTAMGLLDLRLTDRDVILARTDVPGFGILGTQSGNFAAALTLFVGLALTGLLAPLPEATLAAIVIHAIWGMFDVAALRRFLRVDPPELAAASAAIVGVLAFGTMPGLALGVPGRAHAEKSRGQGAPRPHSGASACHFASRA